MEREKAANLLKEIRENCVSFRDLQEVSIAKNPDSEGYLLRAKWEPTKSEQRLLTKMAKKYSIEIIMFSGFTVFRKPKVRKS